jgi:hypothetical protein
LRGRDEKGSPIAASTSRSERMCVINEKFSVPSLNNEPGLVIGKYWASTMELLDVKGTCLSAGRCKSHLYQRNKHMKCAATMQEVHRCENMPEA